MQNLLLHRAGAKGDGADTFSEQHGGEVQRFFGYFSWHKDTFISVVRANSQLVINIIIGCYNYNRLLQLQCLKR